MTLSRPSRLGAAAITGLLLTSAAGCSQGGAGTATSTATADVAVTEAEYDGPDNDNFADFEDPDVVPGTTFVLGFLTAYAAIPGLQAAETAACAQAEDLGGSCIAKDANVNVQTQVSQFNELLSQGVTAIAVQPLDPGALAPSLEAAMADGIPVIGADLPPDPTQGAVDGVTSNVSQALDYSSWATMQAVATEMPDASFAVLGTASPNPLLQFLLDRQQYWGEQFGLTFDGRVDAASDNPTEWATAGSAIASRFPDTDLIVSYNDASAVTALNTVRASGSAIRVANANGYSAVAQNAIRSGGMVASYAVDWEAKGRALANAAYMAATGGDVPETIGQQGQVVTADNVDDVQPTG